MKETLFKLIMILALWGLTMQLLSIIISTLRVLWAFESSQKLWEVGSTLGIFKGRKWSSETLSNLPKPVQLVKSGPRIQTHDIWLQNMFHTLQYLFLSVFKYYDSKWIYIIIPFLAIIINNNFWILHIFF